MYRHYEKHNYNIMYYRFDSLFEYIEFLKSHDICYNLFPNPSSNNSNYDFTMTNSFDEAINLCQYGYHDNFDKLINLKINLEKYIKVSLKKVKQYNDYIGYVPDVKAYLEGNPLSMLNKSQPLRKKIDIYLNSSFAGFTSKDAIFNRGAIVLALIEILETLGFNVDLHLFEMSTVEKQLHFSDFVLKKESERLNPNKLFFPLCHPSWIRRLNFRLIEETPDATNSGWSSGYGKPSTIDIIKQIIEPTENDIIIPTIEEIGINGNDIIDDANQLFTYIENSTFGKEFSLSKVKINKLY